MILALKWQPKWLKKFTLDREFFQVVFQLPRLFGIQLRGSCSLSYLYPQFKNKLICFISSIQNSGKPIEHFFVDDQFEFRHFILCFISYISKKYCKRNDDRKYVFVRMVPNCWILTLTTSKLRFCPGLLPRLFRAPNFVPRFSLAP